MSGIYQRLLSSNFQSIDSHFSQDINKILFIAATFLIFAGENWASQLKMEPACLITRWSQIVHSSPHKKNPATFSWLKWNRWTTFCKMHIMDWPYSRHTGIMDFLFSLVEQVVFWFCCNLKRWFLFFWNNFNCLICLHIWHFFQILAYSAYMHFSIYF